MRLLPVNVGRLDRRQFVAAAIAAAGIAIILTAVVLHGRGLPSLFPGGGGGRVTAGDGGVIVDEPAAEPAPAAPVDLAPPQPGEVGVGTRTASPGPGAQRAPGQRETNNSTATTAPPPPPSSTTTSTTLPTPPTLPPVPISAPPRPQ